MKEIDGNDPLSVPIVPPSEFGIVEENVYRTNIISEQNLLFISQLYPSIKNVILLSPEAPTRTLQTFLTQNSIHLNHQGLKTWKEDLDWKPVSDEMVKEALEFILCANNHPLIIMCTSGVHETGTVVGCLRRLQHYSLVSVIGEYRQYAGPRARYSNEQFIELFDVDLVSFPSPLPHWFIFHLTLLERERQEEKIISKAVELHESQEKKKKS